MRFGDLKRKRKQLSADAAALGGQLQTLRERAVPVGKTVFAQWTAVRNRTAYDLAEQGKGL